jgi:hypothetical protein
MLNRIAVPFGNFIENMLDWKQSIFAARLLADFVTFSGYGIYSGI